MIFWFKKKKIVVDCFTYADAAHELYKIRKSVRYYPDLIKKMDAWVKDAPPLHQSNISLPIPTIKQCTGINGLYRYGAIIPMWADVKFSPKGYVAGKSDLFRTENWYQEQLQKHPPEQFEGLLTSYTQVKMLGVWNLVEKTGVKFIWQPAFWNLNNLMPDLVIPPAITYYDWQPQTNVNVFIKKDAEDFTLFAGTPMIQIIPLVDDDTEVDYKCHRVGYEEFQGKNTIPLTFSQGTGLKNNRFLKDRALADKLDAEDKAERKKCPFGFGR